MFRPRMKVQICRIGFKIYLQVKKEILKDLNLCINREH